MSLGWVAWVGVIALSLSHTPLPMLFLSFLQRLLAIYLADLMGSDDHAMATDLNAIAYDRDDQMCSL